MSFLWTVSMLFRHRTNSSIVYSVWNMSALCLYTDTSFCSNCTKLISNNPRKQLICYYLNLTISVLQQEKKVTSLYACFEHAERQDKQWPNSFHEDDKREVKGPGRKKTLSWFMLDNVYFVLQTCKAQSMYP